MAVGDTVSYIRYNNVRNRIAVVMGQGSATSGYGQPLASNPVDFGGLVQLSDMINLRTDFLKARQHQTGLTESGASYTFNTVSSSTITINSHGFTEGTQLILTNGDNDTVTPCVAPGGLAYNTVYYAKNVALNTFQLSSTAGGAALTITSNGTGPHLIFSGYPVYTNEDLITESAILNFESKIGTIENDRLLIGAGQGLPEAPPTAGISSVRTTAWNAQLVHEVTVDFGSANAARYFFNAAGKLRFYATITGGDGSDLFTDWNTILTSAGVTSLGYTQTTTTGTGTPSSIGFYDLTTSNQLIYTKSGNGNYTANDYSIYARCDVADNSTGGARYVYVRIEFNDDKTINPSVDEDVTGTLTSYVDQFRPQGTNVSVPSPTYTTTTALSGAPVPPTYSISGAPGSGNESSTFTFSVTTTNVTNGTVLYWSVDPVAGVVNASDFADSALTGTVTINSNTGSFTRVMRPDATAEITEQFRIKLFSNSARTTLVATSNTVTVANSS